MEPGLAEAMFESLKLLMSACETLRDRCVTDITANEEHCRNMVMNSIGTITYLNPIIGHRNGDLVGREAARTGESVKEVVVRLGLLTDREVDQYLNSHVYLQPTYTGRIYEEGETGLPQQ